MPKEWIKLHVNRWLHGSTRDELTPAQRSVWIDLLALAGQYTKDDQEEMVLSVSRATLCRLFKIPPKLLDSSLEKFQEHGKITISGDDITIINWGIYNPSRQLVFYHHKAGFDAALQPFTKLPRREEKRIDKIRTEEKGKPATSFEDDLREEFKDLDFDEEVKKCNLWWAEGDRKLKRPQLALRNWMVKARKNAKPTGRVQQRYKTPEQILADGGKSHD